ncbi:MAG TPA: MFS transporter [Elusimicrobiota bacterium]|nr:MFS transporter [Elusimicrobiota bacterium]
MIANSAAAQSPAPSVGERLDRLEWSPFHTRVSLALGIAWLLDSFEVNIIGNVLGLLKKLWSISSFESSLLVSVWLVGIMLGALFFGYLADRYGRRRLFLLTLGLYSAFTLASAAAPGYLSFLFFRFFSAIGVGAEYSAINSAISELIPARFRGRANAMVMNFWPVGGIAAALITSLLINLLPPSIGWRLAFGFGAVIAVFTLWARRALPESPRWLAKRGLNEDARQAVVRIEDGELWFSGPRAAPLAITQSAGFWGQITELIRRCPGRLALGCALDFSEASGYYGIFAFLPLIVLPKLGIAENHVPWFFIVGNAGAAVGGLLAAWALDRIGRKVTVTGFYALAAASMLVMGLASRTGSVSGVTWAFIVANFCATGSWISAYPTFSEIFPTDLRSTGIGFSVAVGRIGAAAAPPLLVYLARRWTPMAAFALLASFWLIGVAAMIPWCIKGPETRGLALEALEA